MKFIRLITLLVIGFTFYTSTAQSQVVIEPDESTREHISADRIGSFYSAFPMAGYTSDWGFYGGGYLQRINYGLDVRPFLSNLKTDFTISTKGYIVSQLEYERTRTFGLDVRSRVEFIGQRIREGHYFGIGNDTLFDKDLYDESYYFYENREFYLKFIGRRKVTEIGENGILDAFGTATLWRVNSLINQDQSLFAENEPAGTGSGQLGKIGTGLILDSRDSEFSPTKGVLYEFGFNISPGLFNGEFRYSESLLNLRHYFNPFGGLVFAHRFKVEEIYGDAPFWALPVIGNELGLRGFHLNRFRGDRTVMQSAELRAWLFSVWKDQISIGSVLFWDSGRVFSDFDSASFFEDWKHSFGIGTVFTLFSPDLIIRADVGFSDESVRIYFGSGFVF